MLSAAAEPALQSKDIINKTGDQSRTALHFAAENGAAEVWQTVGSVPHAEYLA